MPEGFFAHGELTGRIIDCFYATYRELGGGFSEHVYQRALQIVLLENGLKARRSVEFDVQFHGQSVGTCEADLIVEGTILLEVKAMQEIEAWSQGQLLNYLKALGGGVGILLNFGPRGARFKRMVMGNPANSLPNLRPPA